MSQYKKILTSNQRIIVQEYADKHGLSFDEAIELAAARELERKFPHAIFKLFTRLFRPSKEAGE